MSYNHFYISKLFLSGKEVENAVVCFSKGLNVITGPSDTGKTFILQCIDFMLGSKTPPKEIPEAAKYESITLVIIDENDKLISLSRNLSGGKFSVLADGEQKELTATHSSENQSNLSNFLLNMLSLSNNNVKKNMRNETRSLSYRDIAHLTIISEEDIIKSNSPLLSSNYSANTVEKSIFRLLISGRDDSLSEPSEDPKISKAVIAAKLELLSDEINKKKDRINSFGLERDVTKFDVLSTELEGSYHKLKSKLDEVNDTLVAIENDRKIAWTELRRIESRKDVLLGLDERFKLLRKQYESDINRLEAISESGFRLGQLTELRCPICGASPEHHDHNHIIDFGFPDEIISACTNEAYKISSLIGDLENTQNDVRIEIEKLITQEIQLNSAVDSKTIQISDQLKPQFNDLVKKLKDNQGERDSLAIIFELRNQVKDLKDRIEKLNKLRHDEPEPNKSSAVSSFDTNSFSLKVEDILKAWQFPNLNRVVFNLSIYDIEIDGRTRTSHGKGVRAITHAAFTLGLMDYCLEKNLPHPGIVVLDSPLIVYREPDDSDGEFGHEVKESFLRDTARRFKLNQVIILENEAISEEQAEENSINVIRFSGNESGRFGFLEK